MFYSEAETRTLVECSSLECELLDALACLLTPRARERDACAITKKFQDGVFFFFFFPHMSHVLMYTVLRIDIQEEKTNNLLLNE